VSESVRLADLQSEASTAAAAPFDARAWAQRHHWVVALVAYALLTLAFTFPLILHLGDSMAGPLPEPVRQGDSLWYAWYIWAFRRAVSLGQDPAYTHLIYALYPRAEIFAASDYAGAVGLLLLPFLAPLAVYNVLILLTFVLSGLTAYFLVNEFVPNRWAAFVAGFLYTFSTYHFWHAANQLTLATMQWLPLAAWRVFAFYRRPTWPNAIWMGLSLALVPLSDLYLGAYFTLPFGLLFVTALLIANRAWLRNVRNLLRAGVGLALGGGLTFALLASSLRVDPDVQAAITIKATTVQTYSSNLLAYLLPHPANPVFGRFTARFYNHFPYPSFQYPIEQSNYIGIVLLALAAGGCIFAVTRTRTLYFWLAFGVTMFLLSLGPILQVGGHILFPLPFYNALYGWPGLANFRAPNRMGSAVLLGVSVLAGYGLNRLFTWLPGFVRARSAVTWHPRAAVASLGVLLMAASLIEHIQFSFPYPTTPEHVPSIYAQMAADPVPGLVLTVPVYPRGLEMFYQTIHHRGIVTGNPIRTTYPMIRSFENIPYVSLFDWPDSAAANDPAAAEKGQLHDIFPLTESLKQGLQEYGIRYLVLRTAEFPPIEPWMRPLLVAQLGAPAYDNAGEGTTVWRVDPGAVDPQIFRFKLGPGWRPGLRVHNDTVVRVVLQEAQLFVIAPRDGPQHLRLSVSAASPRTMVVSVNGTQVATGSFAQAGVFQTVDLGIVPLHAGQNVLDIRSAQPCTVRNSTIPPTLNPDCNAFEVAQVDVSAP
jgi:hypothetical protein